MSDRPSLLIAATVADATRIKREFRQFSRYHVITPRSSGERGWLYDKYTWTPEAQNLSAKVRWDLRQRLMPATDEHSTEEEFPSQLLAW